MDASRFPATMRSPTQEGSMSLELLAIDLGKRSFHLYGIDTDGVILSRKVSRAKLAEVIGDLGTQGNREGSLRQRALLGSMLAQRRPRGAPHQSSFCEAVRQRLEERCGRRGGDFRSSDASNAEKTRICKVPEGEFDFLGFTFGRMYSPSTGQARLALRPSKKSVRRMIETIHELTIRSGAWQETTGLVE